MSDPNPCAGPFGAAYDFWIERPWLSAIVGRAMWGIDTAPLYASIESAVAGRGGGETLLDVPCGGGLALRALRPAQDVRFVATDISEPMLERTRRRAAARSLGQVETVSADMQALPFADGFADLCLSYSGLHVVPHPRRALGELVRCLRPGGDLVGSTFLAAGTRRQRAIFQAGRRRGLPSPEFTADDLRAWLAEARIEDAFVDRHAGFAMFGGRKQR